MSSKFRYNLSQSLLMMLPDRVGRSIRKHFAARLPKPEYYLVSYPKSGRTWLRLMIGSAVIHQFKLRQQDPIDLEAIGRATREFPSVHVTHDSDSANISYRRIEFHSALYAQSQILFLARDPRDVLASFFYQQKYRRAYQPDMPEFETPDEMVEAEFGGLRALLRFYNVWAENLPKVRGYHLVYYEDLKQDPAREVLGCLEFLGLKNVAAESVAFAAEQGQVEQMRDAERQGKFHGRFRPPDPTNVNSYKVRRGISGGYVDDFSPEAIARMDAIIGEELSEVFSRYKYTTGERQAVSGR